MIAPTRETTRVSLLDQIRAQQAAEQQAALPVPPVMRERVVVDPSELYGWDLPNAEDPWVETYVGVYFCAATGETLRGSPSAGWILETPDGVVR